MKSHLSLLHCSHSGVEPAPRPWFEGSLEKFRTCRMFIIGKKTRENELWRLTQHHGGLRQAGTFSCTFRWWLFYCFPSQLITFHWNRRFRLCFAFHLNQEYSFWLLTFYAAWLFKFTSVSSTAQLQRLSSLHCNAKMYICANLNFWK